MNNELLSRENKNKKKKQTVKKTPQHTQRQPTTKYTFWYNHCVGMYRCGIDVSKLTLPQLLHMQNLNKEDCITADMQQLW